MDIQVNWGIYGEGPKKETQKTNINEMARTFKEIRKWGGCNL